MRFGYLAYRADGTAVKGRLEAPGRTQALESLQRSGLFVVRLQPVRSWAPGRAGAMELAMFYRQLAMGLRVGLPIPEALRLQQEGTRNPLFRETIADLRQQIEAGIDVCAALERHPAVFPRLHVEMVRTGQATGRTHEALARAAEMLAADAALHRQVRAALVYPAFVLGAGALAAAVVFTAVVPRLKQLFLSLNTELPLPTRVLVALGDAARRYGLAGLALLGAAVVLAAVWARRPAGRCWLDAALLRLPLAGPMVRAAAAARFARTLGETLAAGLSAEQALDLAARGTGNAWFEHRLREAAQRVLAGEGLAGPLQGTGLFPELFDQAVRVGEATGGIPEAMAELARHYEEEVRHAVKLVTAALEPLLTLAMAVGVAFFASAVMLPLLRLSQSLR